MSELVDATDRVEMIGFMATDIVDQKQLAEQLLQQAEEQEEHRAGRSWRAAQPADQERARDGA